MTLTEVMVAYPIYSIVVVSIFVTFVSTLTHKWLTNQEHMRNLKSRQEEIQKELKGCKDPSLMQELNLERMKLAGVMFKSSMRPIFVTIIPFLLLFAWIRGIYGGDPPILAHWIWYYIGFSIVSSMVIKKALRVA